MPLRRLEVTDFQSHEKLGVDFGRSATVVVGPSDAGKSAVVRALRWLAANRPAGASFVRKGAAGSKVKLTFDDGRVAVRRRGAKGNVYLLDGKRYAAFGAGVPDAVAAALNLDPALNFQNQHDGPFWFSLSPGEVSKELNRVVNLDLIDRVLASLAGELRRAKATADVARERLAEARRERKRLAWVADADRELRAVEELYKNLAELALKRDRLALMTGQAVVAQGNAHDAAQAKRYAARAVRRAGAALEAQSRTDRLAEVIQDITETEERAATISKSYNKAVAELERRARGTCPVCGGRFSEKSRK